MRRQVGGGTGAVSVARDTDSPGPHRADGVGAGRSASGIPNRLVRTVSAVMSSGAVPLWGQHAVIWVVRYNVEIEIMFNV